MRARTFTALCVALLAAADAAGQEPRAPVRVTVTQVAGSTVYIDAGSAAGLEEGMTVDVRAASGVVLGTLVVVGVTDDRAGLSFAGAAFPLTRGQTLVLEVPLTAAPDEARDSVPLAGAPPSAASAGGGSGPGGPRVTGSVGLELEAYRATSSWAEQVDGRVTEQLTRPALRLRGHVTGLPGGLVASTNLRLWHRGTSAAVYDAGTSIRVYQASVARETGFFRFRAGRFWVQQLPLSAYWDGGLLRLGGSVGAGVAVGFTPAGGAEGVDADAPKIAAFVDYEHRGVDDGPETSGAFSLVQRRIPWEDTTVRSVGWSQRARWGPARLAHRLEVEPGADDVVRHATVDLTVDVRPGVRLSAGWLRDRYRPVQIVESQLLTPRVRERTTLGLAWNGATAGLDLRGGLLGGDQDGRSLDGTVWTGPFRPGWPSVSLAASYWSDADRSWFFISPSLRRQFGVVDARLAYHHYRIDEQVDVRLHGGDASVSFPLGAFRARFGLQGEAGGDLVTVRALASLWLRF